MPRQIRSGNRPATESPLPHGPPHAADRWMQIFQAFPLPVVTLGATGVILEANRAANCQGDAVAQRNVRDLVAESDGALIAAAIDAARGGEISYLDVRYYLPDGTLRIGEATIAPWDDPTGRAVALGILRDTTAEHETRHQLVQVSKLATVGELLAGVSHELNNPLTAVLSYAELLAARDDLPSDARSDLADLRREALRAAQIVRQLLAFVRRRDPLRLPVDLNEIVRDTVALRDGALRRAGVNLVLELGEIRPVAADQFQFQQIVLNLLTNAEYAVVNASQPRVIRVSTRPVRGGAELEVSDSGSGIADDLLPRVFDPFVTTRRAGEGTGLGLAIAQRIVAEHGGRISAHNRPDGGATFTVFLPFEPGPGA